MAFGSSGQFRAWRDGIKDELYFWRQWVATEGLEWPDEYSRRFDDQRPLDELLQGIVRQQRLSTVSILDVGAGPVTVLGARMPGVSVELLPTDPLARGYARILREHGKVPPIETAFAVGEDLTSFVGCERFDIVHCRNALDHSLDPMAAILEMLRAAKTGGIVLLRHYRNEAETESYEGFHQHNFDVVDGRLVLWNKESRIDVAASVPFDLEIHSSMVREGKVDWITSTMRRVGKIAEPAGDAQARQRIRRILTDMMDLFVDDAFSYMARGA